MFEDQLQAVQELLSSNSTFKKLHDEHSKLREEIILNQRSRDHFALERMKREKLRLKDRMALILNEHSNT